ncbi:hypothetical protein BLNAU_15770 [Blattamonas nauphoetae]|uniref:Cyclin N-terminal domain-containing protein n=1 Tax=Blattamonas nauphoetae TaxID=2049346 RepID=A0ABQ9XD33_9EUKA|nr:hypothetical protein BLNAU_15770 [Blattamonas nauphoetae]
METEPLTIHENGTFLSKPLLTSLPAIEQFPLDHLFYLSNELAIRIHNLIFCTPEYQTILASTLGTPIITEPDPRWIPEMSEVIFYFLDHICSSSNVHVMTILYAFCLMFKALSIIPERLHTHPVLIIDESNLGSFLMSAVILANKQLEDHPYTNKCWAQFFDIDTTALNTAEIVFLLHLDFSAAISPEDIVSVQSQLTHLR